MHRLREWDAVVLVELPSATGDHLGFVVLADGSCVIEAGEGTIDPAELVASAAIRPPFRAEAVRRSGSTWAVGTRAIVVAELAPSRSGGEVEVVWDGAERTVRIDGEPSFSSVPELERLASARFDSWVARARRICDDVWEVEIEPL
jgi:hypothetical protein